jgi:hypothetical protein
MDDETPRVKSSLVIAAERIDRQAAVCSGYLRKQNAEGRWQRRYFEIVGNYFVYYKRHDAPQMLCAMDLWKAGSPELSVPPPPEKESPEFGIAWDRYRLFRAASHADAVRWVTAMAAVQARRPPPAAGAAAENGAALPAFAQPGGSIAAGAGVGEAAALARRPGGAVGGALSKDDGSQEPEEWGHSKHKHDKGRGGGSDGLCGGSCVVA